jgi:hypothetical protein
MRNTRFLLPALVTCTVVLASCNFPLLQSSKSSAPHTESLFSAPTIPPALLAGLPTELPTPVPTPDCPDRASFGKIYTHLPSDFEVVSASPELTWFYTSANGNPGSVEAWANECVPEAYTVYFSTGPDFEDEIVVPVTDPEVVADSGKLTMNWTIPTSLEVMKVYRWAVVGHANGFDIEGWRIADLHDDAIWPPINNVNMTYKRCVFRTGPECAAGQIGVPTLTTPSNGEVIQTLNPILTWDVSSCMPTVFWLEISTLPTFDNPQFSVYPIPTGDYTKQTQRNFPSAYIDYTLRDCTKYYWRVKGGGYSNGGEWGNYSEVGTFSVNLGQCPTPTPTRVPATKTPTPTSSPTPVPVTCEGLTMAECGSYPSLCKWVFPVTHVGPGACKPK